MWKLLCRLLGLHHYVFKEPEPKGYCKHCGKESMKSISVEEWKEIRGEVESAIEEIHNATSS